MSTNLATFSFSEVKTNMIVGDDELLVNTPAVSIHQPGQPVMVVTLDSLPPEIYNESLRNEQEARAIVNFITSDSRSPWIQRYGKTINSTDLKIDLPDKVLRHSESSANDGAQLNVSQDLIINPAHLTQESQGPNTGNSVGFSVSQFLEDSGRVGFSEFYSQAVFSTDKNLEALKNEYRELAKDPVAALAFVMGSSERLTKFVQHVSNNPDLGSSVNYDGHKLSRDDLARSYEMYLDNINLDDIEFEPIIESPDMDSEPDNPSAKGGPKL